MFPNINPRQMEKAMRQMGIKSEEIDATEVIIRLNSGSELVISNPSVQKVTMAGNQSFQISGEAVERSARAQISEEDIAIVAEKAGVSREKAKSALQDAKGDIAEAIMNAQE